MPRPRGLPKTGGRKPGSRNKERIVIPEVLPPETAESMMAETARAMVLASSPIRTPKAVMLDAMMRFEALGMGFLKSAERLQKRNAEVRRVAEAANEGHKFIVAAVECATKVAPFIHARLLAVESRGDMTQDKVPYVVRVPAVLENSAAWQAAVGMAVLETEVLQAPSGAAGGTLAHPGLPQPTAPEPAPVPSLVALVADQKTGRITAMPAGPKIVQPAGSAEWLAAVTAERRKAAG